MNTKILAEFGVYGAPTDSELAVLAMADAFRRELAGIYQRRYNAEVDYRNRRSPGLLAALVRESVLWHRIAAVEKAIKAHHCDVRDRNAVTPDQEAALRSLRAERDAASAAVRAARAEWTTERKAFGQWWKSAADWKRVKDLARRRAAYAALEPPAEMAEWCAIHCALDLEERELYRRYQERGLHSAIRAEIVEATQPKLRRDGPGMRYRYGRQPNLQPWQKLTLQFPGGVTLQELIDGNCPPLRLTPRYSRGEATVYDCVQQIGTAEQPRWIEYAVKFDRPVPEDTRWQRWTLKVAAVEQYFWRGERRTRHKRTVLPLAADVPAKPVGSGAFAYRLRWTVRGGGIEVAEFWGAHVRERLIVPTWLVASRMALHAAQADSDERANVLLETRGVSRSKRPGSLHGVAALEAWCANSPADAAAGNLLDALRETLRKAARRTRRAIRAIESIYRTVACRVCSRHAAVAHPQIDLRRIKRYDTRDLLRVDVLPPESRTIMHEVAPGKLKALIAGWGLPPAASEEVPPPNPGGDRETDLFTSYIANLGRSTRRLATTSGHARKPRRKASCGAQL